MTIRPVYAKDELGRMAVKGKIQAVMVHLWKDGTVIKAVEIPPNLWPFQSNNMVEWYRRAAHILRSADLFDATTRKSTFNQWKFVINDGEGVKEGRGRSRVKFTIVFGESLVKMDIWIHTIQHAQLYQQRKRIEMKERTATDLDILAKGGIIWQDGIPYIMHEGMMYSGQPGDKTVADVKRSAGIED